MNPIVNNFTIHEAARTWSRRDFLETASVATLSALAAGYPRAVFSAEAAEEYLRRL